MESKNKCKNVGLSAILWAYAAIMLCALPCVATINVPLPSGETTLNVDGNISDSVNVNSGGILNLLDGGTISGNVYAFNDSEVNITGGTVDGWIIVETQADVTVFGTGFKLNGDDLDPSETYFTIPQWGLYTLEGTYGGDAGSIYLTFYCYSENGAQINLAEPSTKVQIDIKPGNEDNIINLGSNGVIPVAILSSADFDATTVDPTTIELSGAEVAVRGKGTLTIEKDVNGDGLIDLEVKVETENLDPGIEQDGSATLTGETYDGVEITGSDDITIVPPE
jgi:hypothetical protein